MGAIKKVGVPFYVKVDTNKDILGRPEGFKVQAINDLTGEVIKFDTQFEEIEKQITPFQTTASADASVGSNTLSVQDASGFEAGDVVAVNGFYSYIKSVDTTNNTLTLVTPLNVAVKTGDVVAKSGKTGIYRAKVQIDTPGDFTFVVSNFAEGMDNVSFPVKLMKADVDDVKALLDELKPEVDDIKSQIDLLDEEELNNLKEYFDNIKTTLENIEELVFDEKDLFLKTDAKLNANAGDEVVGATSGAKGIVEEVREDGVILSNVSGTFQVDETLQVNGTDTGVKVTEVIKNTINNILEFVREINEAIETGSDAFKTIQTIEKDIEHLINGDATLEDGSECPTAGKGLTQIFDELVSAHNDVTAIKTLAEDANYGFQALANKITDAQNNIIAKINSLIDENDANSLISKINAVKSVLDANNQLLTNDTYGLEALKNLLDQDLSTIITNFNDVQDKLDTIINKIDEQTAHIDDRFDVVEKKLDNIQGTKTFAAFA